MDDAGLFVFPWSVLKKYMPTAPKPLPKDGLATTRGATIHDFSFFVSTEGVELVAITESEELVSENVVAMDKQKTINAVNRFIRSVYQQDE